MKLKVTCRPQNVKDARAMEYLLRKAANREWNKPRNKMFVEVNNDENKAGDVKNSLKSDMEVQSLELVQLISCLVLGITVK